MSAIFETKSLKFKIQYPMSAIFEIKSLKFKIQYPMSAAFGEAIRCSI